jgi:cytoskeletal protein RodZ
MKKIILSMSFLCLVSLASQAQTEDATKSAPEKTQASPEIVNPDGTVTLQAADATITTDNTAEPAAPSAGTEAPAPQETKDLSRPEAVEKKRAPQN